MSRLNLAVASLTLLIAPRLAEAHFKLVVPTNWWTQANDGSPQKAAPCGDVNESTASAGTTATKVVNVYQPGQTVTVTVTATISHFGWWRISLREGAVSTQTATTIPDPTPNASCVVPFMDNPVWSPTQPVIADKLGIPAGSTATNINQTGTQNYQVTIPQNAHCSMASPCTLQVLMIMTTDHAPPNCFYHHCADMMLAGGATGTGGSTGDAGAKDASAGMGGKTGAGGSTATGTGGAPGTGTGGAPAGGAGGSTVAGTGGMTTGGAGTGGAMAGEGGSSGGGQDSGTGGARGGTNGCSYAGGGSVGGTSCGVLLIALLALKSRRRKSAS
jgi:hypothetical protein